MEFCRRWGLVEAVENAGFPRDSPMSIVYATAVLGHELARDEYPEKRHAQSPPFSPSKHELCPQNYFDPVMQRAALAYTTNRLLFSHRLVRLNQTRDSAVAEVEDAQSGKTKVFRARYVAACDGASSTVAHQLGLSARQSRLLSFSTNIFVRCPGLAARCGRHRAYRYVLMGPEGLWATVVNIDGRDLWRLQVIGDSTRSELRRDDIDAYVRKAIAADIDYELIAWVPWTRREFVAEQYHVGRCFLVGDAAHQLSPTGGYGMNLGIAEAVDLSWKLAAIEQGWGGRALLESYALERRPVAAATVRQASRNLAAMLALRPETHLLDSGLVGETARLVTGRAMQSTMHREYRSFGVHLGAVYKDSPIIVEDEKSSEHDFAEFLQSTRVGGRAPHAWITPDRSTLDLFGRGFVLVEMSGGSDTDADGLFAAAAAAGVPLTREILASSDIRALYERRYTLVRPDGFIAWRGDAIPQDPHLLIDRVRGAMCETASEPV